MIRWRVLRVSVPDALDDEIAAVLGGGSLGVEVAPTGAGRSELRVYLGPADDAAAWKDRAARSVAAHGMSAGDAAIRLEPVEDERWAERWQETLRPIPVGTRFVVLPSPSLDPPAGRIPIRLVPGMAFGTGEHETTRLCAAAVEREAAAGSTWLDLGTGSGLLALIAAHAGASRVMAVDLDPESAHVAQEAVQANGMGDRVTVRAGSIDACGGERFDGIVANIQASFFLRHAQELAGALRPGGTLIASGFLLEDLAEIEETLRAAGIVVPDRRSEGAWACLVARLSG
ncbi:MAG TPA: 50S ribosomal protein L11 methyltransferase [Candidatus Polarisedimenticolaceae bacterium]|nr:50S ribosomal protein L11 methyltransferase [Candidatus Polarisedimenticolaceae bacterium]